MRKKIFLLLSIIFAFACCSCSSSIEETRQETEAENETEEAYVFDEVPENDTEENFGSEETFYIVQIGAFTTKQSAENFADESKKILSRDVSVSYSSDVNLFTVRIDGKFRNKSEAEKLRDEIRLNEEFKDAWVVTSIK